MRLSPILFAGAVALLGQPTGAAKAEPDAGLRIAPPPIDSRSPLEMRVGPAPPAFFDMLALPQAKSRVLTEADRRKLAAALAVLTPLQRRVLQERLASISFVEGMPNNALTYPNPSDPTQRTFNITIRAGVLNETVSELVTRKERSCFDMTAAPLELSINAGAMDALVYVLLHEATHVVDSSLGLTAEPRSGSAGVSARGVTTGVWQDRLTSVPAYSTPLLRATCWRKGGGKLGVDQAAAVYRDLARTPFASLYASNNWHDDLAELVAWDHLTRRLGQPYRIEIRDHGQLVLAYAPMKNPRVRRRLHLLRQFY